MTNEKNQPQHESHGPLESKERKAEAQSPTDKTMGKSVISTVDENAQHDRLKILDAVKSFKFTGADQQSFGIDMGNGVTVKDNRPLRGSSNSHDGGGGGAAGGGKSEVSEKTPDSSAKTTEPINGAADLMQRIMNIGKALGNDLQTVEKAAEKSFNQSREVDVGHPVTKDYTDKNVRTRAPNDVLVIGAEGLPGRLFSLQNGKYNELKIPDVINDIKKDQVGKPDPKLVYIEACHSGEGKGDSTASAIAKGTHSYVVGNIGLGDSLRPDRTFPDHIRIPGTDIVLPVPNPIANSQVALYNPKGEEVARFETPVDWKKVKETMQALEKKEQK